MDVERGSDPGHDGPTVHAAGRSGLPSRQSTRLLRPCALLPIVANGNTNSRPRTGLHI